MAKMDGVITVRLPQEDKKRWQAIADENDISLGNWIRKKVDGDLAVTTEKPTPRQAPKVRYKNVNPELIREVAKVGNNLNQIARWCNTHKNDADSLQVLAQLKAIEEAVRGIKNAHKAQ